MAKEWAWFRVEYIVALIVPAAIFFHELRRLHPERFSRPQQVILVYARTDPFAAFGACRAVDFIEHLVMYLLYHPVKTIRRTLFYFEQFSFRVYGNSHGHLFPVDFNLFESVLKNILI